jgi:hypothetical protein
MRIFDFFFSKPKYENPEDAYNVIIKFLNYSRTTSKKTEKVFVGEQLEC